MWQCEIPRGSDGMALKDGDEDRADPKGDDDSSCAIHQAMEPDRGKYPYVGIDDRDVGQGNGCCI